MATASVAELRNLNQGGPVRPASSQQRGSAADTKAAFHSAAMVKQSATSKAAVPKLQQSLDAMEAAAAWMNRSRTH
jgi:hypothetical protein